MHPTNPHKHWIFKITKEIKGINGDKRAIACFHDYRRLVAPQFISIESFLRDWKKKNLLIEDSFPFGESFIPLRQGNLIQQINIDLKIKKQTYKER